MANIAADLAPLVRPIESLKLDGKNARKHPKRSIESIRASLEAFGQRKPIVVRDGVVVAGNGMLQAAIQLGWDRIAVTMFDGTASQARAYAIADNRIAELSTWDRQQLPDQLREMHGSGWGDIAGGAAALGFTDAELAGWGILPKAGDLDRAPPLPKKPVARKGDLWQLGEHRLACGSSTEQLVLAALFGALKAALCNTDPPYGIDYVKLKDVKGRKDIENDDLVDGKALQAFLESYIRVAVPHLLDNAAHYMWHPMLTQGTFFAAAAAAADILVHRQIVWVKPSLILTRSGMYHWRHELCFYGWRRGFKPPWYGDKKQDTVWEVGYDAEAVQHPTQKPIELFRRPILNHTQKGEIVYEPFSGSGSQIIAAEQFERRCFAVEIDPGYVDVAIQRWEHVTGKKAKRVLRGR